MRDPRCKKILSLRSNKHPKYVCILNARPRANRRVLNDISRDADTFQDDDAIEAYYHKQKNLDCISILILECNELMREADNA